MKTSKLPLWLQLVFLICSTAENINPDLDNEGNREERKLANIYRINSRPQKNHKSSIKEALLLTTEFINSEGCVRDGKPCPPEETPCMPMMYCAAFYKEALKSNSFCKLGPNEYGIRCRIPKEGNGRPIKLQNLFPPISQEDNSEGLTSMDIEGAMNVGYESLQFKKDMEKNLTRMGLVVNDPRTADYGHLQLFRTYPRAVNRSNIALVHEYARNNLQENLDLNGITVSHINFSTDCLQRPVCEFQDLFYRRPDGSCNNLENPTWGRAFSHFQRLTPVTYDDGISIPRKSVTGKPLPSGRKVSATIIQDADVPSQEFTLAVMQWGQLTDHDLAQSPISIIDNVTGIQCCDPSGQHLDPSLSHPECFPIDIPADDSFYSMFDQRCMNFVRSLPAPNINCRFGFRNQMDQLTHFMDGSMVYGSTKNQLDALREFKYGLLKMREEQFLPDDLTTERFDFLAGDNRVNEQPLLTVIHTIWMRQHNRVAGEICKLKPEWNDEAIFQETRKIIVGQIQHILYNEWLPNILGTETVENYNLLPKRNGFINTYDKNLNPGILNEFASVAFRFGHTLLQGTIRLFGKNHEEIKKIELSDNFEKPEIFTESTKMFSEAPLFNRLLKGLFNQPVQSFDNCIIDDVTNKLLKTDFMPFGMDLIALNTQRARDHGVGTYNDILEACGMQRTESFYDLHKYMRPNAVPRFASIYESVDDIDPFVAGVSENPIRGGVLGGIFNCIVREQFTRLKFGDRFFYENGGMQSSFTEDQLNEIRKTSFARIICDNSKGNVQKIQPLAFRLIDKYNVKVPCTSDAIPNPDFSSWYKI